MDQIMNPSQSLTNRLGYQQRDPKQLNTKEMACLCTGALFLLVAVIGLAYGVMVPQHNDYHAFADQRTLLNLPFAADVLSNLPFGIIGVIGLGLVAAQRSSDEQKTQLGLFTLSFLGLILTTLASSFYHFSPNNYGLSIDRLGMTSAFAGIIGLAVATRISDRAGMASALTILILAPFSIVHWYQTDNLWLWSVLQGGGMIALVLLALRSTLASGISIRLGWIVAPYAIAKVLELSDHAIFEFSQHTVSGHSLKHLAAAAAAWPLIVALRQIPNASANPSVSTKRAN
jgi:hypothetical protein